MSVKDITTHDLSIRYENSLREELKAMRTYLQLIDQRFEHLAVLCHVSIDLR